MITNSSGHKLKAFRSTRDLGDVKDSDAENRSKVTDKGGDKERVYVAASDGINQRASSSIVICQRDRADNRLKPRPRTRDDFRMARGGVDRRNTNVRGRGACMPRKGERDHESGYIPRGKFQESLNKGTTSETVVSSSSKYFNDAENKTRSEYNFMVPEDSRISKLLRRLSREEDPEKFCSLAKQLQDSLMVPENGRYIKRAFDLITESLLDLLHTGPGSEAKSQASKCLGRLGYVYDQDFKRYVDWIFSTYCVERNEEVRLLLVKAIHETLTLDKETLKTKEFAGLLMSNLQNTLEFTDSADFLIGTVDAILLLTDMYPSSFSKHFRDTVDILVGWHIDSSLKSQITEYASRSLQKLNRYWIVDLEFSVTLISQFLEDMEAYGDDIHLSNDLSGRSSPDDDPILSPEQCIIKITSLIKVLNTVLKCLGQHLNPILSPSISWNFLINCLTKVLQTVLLALEFLVREELIIAANECASLLVTFLQTKITSTNGKLYELINVELSVANQLGEEAIIYMLTLISKVVRDVSSNLPVELIQQILGSKSPILKLRFSPSQKIQNEVLCVYHSLLNLKNIPLLQEAYRYVLVDLEIAYKNVVPSISEFCQSNSLKDVQYNEEEVEMVVIFHLKALADLANASNSIIGMWALQPSILELLGVKLKPHHPSLVHHSPMLQYCIIHLLYSHCARYSNFVSSSGLVSSAHSVTNVCDMLGLPISLGADVPSSSPTSGHLSVILIVLTQILSEPVYSKTTMELTLKWTGEIISQAQSYLSALQNAPEFCDLLQVLVNVGHNGDESTVLEVLKNLKELLASGNVLWKASFLSNILSLCLLHCNSTNEEVSTAACHLMTLLPWYVTIKKLRELTERKPNGNVKSVTISLSSLHDIQKFHISKANFGEMRGIQFKKFMGYLLHGIQHLENSWMQDMFHSCWPVQVPRHLSPEDANTFRVFKLLACSNNVILMLWSTWEAGQFCITSKLRTPLGKPQDTFTSIEGAIKDLARELHNMFNVCQLEDAMNNLSVNVSTTSTTQLGVIGNISSNDMENSSLLSNVSGSSAFTSTIQEDPKEENLQLKQSCVNVEQELCIKCHTEDWEQRRVRLLLEFLEHLEKCIHNAAEGSATSLLPASKNVRIFFHTNKSTCAEWLTRIRMAVLIVALHAGQATAVVRHGHCLLQDLVESKSTQGAEFERTVLYLSWALCQLREPEAIVGLFVWCREQGRKFVWLKAIAEQAAGRYEAAADDYRRILEVEHFTAQLKSASTSEESVYPKHVGRTETEMLVIDFLADQLINCYLSLKNWEEFLKWKQEEGFAGFYQNTKNLFGNALTVKQAQAMQAFEQNGLSALSELENWNSVQVGTGPINADKCWNSCLLIKQVESTLVNISLKLAADCNIQKSEGRDLSEQHNLMKTVIENCMSVSKRHIQEGLRNVPSECVQNCVISQFAGSGLLSVLNGEPEKNVFTMANPEVKPNYANTGILTSVLWWATYFDQMSGKRYHNKVNALCLEVSRIARKEGNYRLAKNLLVRFLTADGGFSLDFSAFKEISLKQIVESLIDSWLSFGDTWDVSIARAYIEVAKLLYSASCHSSAIHLCGLTSLAIVQQPSGVSLELEERKSRTLLTLAKWLQVETQLVNEIGDLLTQIFSCENSSPNKDMKVLDVMTLEHCNLLLQNGTQVIPPADTIVGRLLYMSITQCPTLAKSWSNFAAWCYRWGRRVVDAASESGGQLSDMDRDAVQRLLPTGMPTHDLEKVYSIVCQTKAVDDEEDIEVEDYNTSEMIETQLQTVRSLSGASQEQLAHLVDVWRSAQKRVYVYYELSAVAYFKFLELCGDKEGTDCTTITATLRLLRLIVKHALELQGVLELGLDSTPTRPWKGIIPQLFSRLSHPEPYVRRRVSELLCRVAEDAPHLITFPAVVGAATGTRLKDMNIPTSTSKLFSACLSQPSGEGDIDEDEDDEDEEDDEDDDDDDEGFTDEENKVSVLKNCFLAMVDILAKQAPEAISQVKLLVQELRRITLLWDELWLGTLVQHHAEITRRLSQLELEVIRVDENLSLTPEEKKQLIAEKHRIILKPIVYVLEQLQTITSVQPETPHEKWFQEKFGGFIKEALLKLKQPSNPRRPHESWQPMKQLQTRLQQRSQKRAAYTIHMSDVSPALSEMKKTVIAMPGVSSCERNIITIAAVDNNVAILPTKTKPKKLIFHGSDGQMYTYLFKGLEDLHLDERIMQFLSIANTMMQRGSGTQNYYARHYSVIPLGPRSGLISWVDGVTPLFSLYKRWQQREIVSVTLKIHSNAGPLPGPVQVMRPSELFYNKLGPLLKERGITNVENRKDWPLPVLRQVLTELMEETPRDLLAKELWCNSINAGSWWQTTRTYSYSVAVMSMIGYIIGLGDRHLDNVLVDLCTGEVVHIDYNVCFEKGKTLRVPEKVPFRMTPNIRTALGVTGVEGIFRQASEHVLKVMKKGRETLLTLLEAFVYDPLIDWKPGNEAGYTGAVYGGQAVALESKQTRKELEREVTQSMFCVRMAEMKSDWLSNRDDLLSSMPPLENLLGRWTEIQEEIKAVEEILQDCHQQMALVKEAEAHGPGGQHPLYSLGMRYAKYRRAKDAMEKARVALKDKLEETEKHYKLQKAALAAVRGTQLGGWVADLNYPVEKDSHLVFDLVKEFLQNAGQNQMILQCEQSETELGQLAQQQTILIHSCLDLLSQYGAIAGLYPTSYFKKHRTVCFHRWTKYLLEKLSVERVHDVATQFQKLFSPDIITNNPLCRTAVSFSYQLQSALQEANVRFSNALEKMNAKGLPEGRLQFEKDYDDAHKTIEDLLAADPRAILELECVNVAALCTLNKRYLMMEAAAASAGDCLVDLTSREGEWFLDEMHFVSTLVSEFCNILPYQRNPNIPEAAEIPSLRLALQCLYSANVIFRGLKELNFNFHTIILPEALKALQTEEPSVISIIETLDEIIQSVGIPITDLLAQLELHLRYVIMDMESPHSHVHTVVFELRTKYESLLLHCPDMHREEFSADEGLSPGQMLLMGFNGLFEKLQLEGAALVTALETIETPPSWKKVDQVREAKALSAPVFSERTRAVLDSIFLLKRLQTIQDFFGMCAQMARMGAPIYDDDRLNKPIRRFTADYVRRQMLGVSSQTLALAICFLLHQRLGLNVTVEVEQRDIGAESKVSLEELIHKAVDMCVKCGKVSTATLAEVSGLTSNLEGAWRRRELALSAQQECEIRRSTSQRLQLQLTAHHWLFEDLLLQNAPMSTLLPINRTTFMREVRKTSSTLLALQSRLNDAHEQQNILVASVEQRLKWAAGANPALNEVMAAFECALQKRTSRLNTEQRLAAVVGNTCNAILHHEALRTRTSEAIANDTSFLQMLDQLEKSCVLAGGCEQVISAAEEALVHMLIPEGNVDLNWIHKVELCISDKVKSLQDQKTKLQDDLFSCQENLKKHVLSVRSFLSVHHRLMLDVRNLLKSMAKSEAGMCSGLNDYLASYKKFSEYFSSLIRELMVEDLDHERVQRALDQLQVIKAKTGAIYAELLEFAVDLRENMKAKTASEEMFLYSRPRRPPLTRQEGLCVSPKKVSTACPVGKAFKTGRDPRTGKAVQERNAYALGVWRRVRMKLEGRDPDLGRKISVQEQVDYVIREALSLDNLALLYEGWTPWV